MSKRAPRHQFYFCKVCCLAFPLTDGHKSSVCSDHHCMSKTCSSSTTKGRTCVTCQRHRRVSGENECHSYDTVKSDEQWEYMKHLYDKKYSSPTEVPCQCPPRALTPASPGHPDNRYQDLEARIRQLEGENQQLKGENRQLSECLSKTFKVLVPAAKKDNELLKRLQVAASTNSLVKAHLNAARFSEFEASKQGDGSSGLRASSSTSLSTNDSGYVGVSSYGTSNSSYAVGIPIVRPQTTDQSWSMNSSAQGSSSNPHNMRQAAVAALFYAQTHNATLPRATYNGGPYMGGTSNSDGNEPSYLDSTGQESVFGQMDDIDSVDSSQASGPCVPGLLGTTPWEASAVSQEP
jgi:hypothetical protein